MGIEKSSGGSGHVGTTQDINSGKSTKQARSPTPTPTPTGGMNNMGGMGGGGGMMNKGMSSGSGMMNNQAHKAGGR
ncbi:unnamed protein product [Cylicostephanus goldi]|uniref:Uncharacterized protein n=1 Tax=Cylicostephanus goldi TaxID=71465 RepID=A0A3P6SGZ5_CYLGO|nr:unnamed protein product [Cylicostephanus goldi]